MCQLQTTRKYRMEINKFGKIYVEQTDDEINKQTKNIKCMMKWQDVFLTSSQNRSFASSLRGRGKNGQPVIRFKITRCEMKGSIQTKVWIFLICFQLQFVQLVFLVTRERQICLEVNHQAKETDRDREIGFILMNNLK